MGDDEQGRPVIVRCIPCLLVLRSASIDGMCIAEEMKWIKRKFGKQRHDGQ